jgi:hypothetical protein
MMKLEFSVADATPCFSCGVELSLKDSKCLSCGSESNIRLNSIEFYNLFMEGSIIDARSGGLIIGRDDSAEDIPILSPLSIGVFHICGLMQGGEYILNANASTKHSARVKEINSYNDRENYKPLNSLKVMESTSVINTNTNPGKIILLVDNGQFIVNRAATVKYYRELENINMLTNIFTDLQA